MPINWSAKAATEGSPADGSVLIPCPELAVGVVAGSFVAGGFAPGPVSMLGGAATTGCVTGSPTALSTSAALAVPAIELCGIPFSVRSSSACLSIAISSGEVPNKLVAILIPGKLFIPALAYLFSWLKYPLRFAAPAPCVALGTVAFARALRSSSNIFAYAFASSGDILVMSNIFAEGTLPVIPLKRGTPPSA